MHYDPWLTEISPADIEAARKRKVAREALIAEQAAEIARLRVEQGEARGYLSRLLQFLYPSIEILPDMLGVCTQIDNVLAGQREEITRLRAALATARREGMEEAAKIGDRHIEIGEVLSETEADKRLADNIKMQVGAMKQVVDAIRAAAKEGKP